MLIHSTNPGGMVGGKTRPLSLASIKVTVAIKQKTMRECMVWTLFGDKVLLCSLIPGVEMRLNDLARGWGVPSLHHPLPLKDKCSYAT